MGASLVYLNEPNKEIEHEDGENDYLKFSVGQMQGWRLNMVSILYEFRSQNLIFNQIFLIIIGRCSCCKSEIS